MILDQVEKFRGQQVGHVRAEVPGGVGHDDIELPAGTEPQPAPPIVGDDADLRIGEHGGHLGGARHEREIAGIDLDHGKRRDVGIAGDHLRPGARGEPDHQNVARCGMKQAQRIGSHDAVGIVLEIGVEAAVIHAMVEHGAVGIDGDDAAAGLDDIDQRLGLGRPFPLQVFQEATREGGHCDRREHGEHRGAACAQDLLPARASRCSIPGAPKTARCSAN